MALVCEANREIICFHRVGFFTGAHGAAELTISGIVGITFFDSPMIRGERSSASLSLSLKVRRGKKEKAPARFPMLLKRCAFCV